MAKVEKLKWRVYPKDAEPVVHIALREQVIPPMIGENRIRPASLSDGVVLFWFDFGTTPSFFTILPRPKAL